MFTGWKLQHVIIRKTHAVFWFKSNTLHQWPHIFFIVYFPYERIVLKSCFGCLASFQTNFLPSCFTRPSDRNAMAGNQLQNWQNLNTMVASENLVFEWIFSSMWSVSPQLPSPHIHTQRNHSGSLLLPVRRRMWSGRKNQSRPQHDC